MDLLKELVSELEKKTCYEEQIKILQQMGDLLINNYVIKVGSLEIQPIWVEAYYYHPNKFEDKFTHAYKNKNIWKEQSNRFGALYIHKTGYGGVDIVLSRSEEYCLSFLLKYTIINGDIISQVYLPAYIDSENIENVLFEKSKSAYPIWHLKRVFHEKQIAEKVKKDKFQSKVFAESLTGFRYDVLKTPKYSAKIKPNGSYLQDSILEYAKDYYAKSHNAKETKHACRQQFHYVPDAVTKYLKNDGSTYHYKI